MMYRQKEISLALVDHENQLIDRQIVSAFDDGRNVTIQCLRGPLKGNTYTGVDYFWLMGDLRSDLYKLGLRPLVKGAIKNVFPGGLAGETSLGLIAYIIDDQGKGVGNANIFEQADISEASSIVSFEDQKSHRKMLAQKRRSRRL